MKKNKKTKRKAKIISIIVVLSVLIGNITGIGAEVPYEREKYDYGELTPNDPLEYMQNEPNDLKKGPDEIWERQNDPELPKPPEGMRELPQDDGSTDRYIVKYNPSGKENFRSKLSSQVAYSESIGINGEWEVLRLHEKTLPMEFAESIRSSRALADIAFIQPDYKLSLESINDDETANDEQDSGDENEIIETEDETDESIYEKTEYIETEEETDEKFLTDEITPYISLTGEIIVAVIDTGVDIYHNDLAEYIDTTNMWDFTQNSSQIYDPANPLDSAHGTHIAGIIAATARENGIGNIKILPLRVFAGGAAYTSDIIAAVEYAAAKGAAIINCSFGSAQENPALRETIANTDALFVCAAGNNRRDLTELPSYPACYDLPNIISVASVNVDGGFSYFSNYGENVDITALGRDVWSTLPENNYGPQTGTSMSAAYVIAAAAAVGANETLTADALKICIRRI